MRVTIDDTKCQGHSRCYSIAPDVFHVDDYGVASVRIDGDVPEALEAKVRLAVANCPERAISIEE